MLKAAGKNVQFAQLKTFSKQGSISRDIVHYFSPNAKVQFGPEFEEIKRLCRTGFEWVAVIELDIHHFVGVPRQQSICLVVDGMGAHEESNIDRLFLIDLFI